LCLLLTWCAQAQCPDLANGQNEAPGVKMTLTKFEVSDTTLELGFEITNDSDHNIWICNYISKADFEAYFAEGKPTLVIRRRFDVPSAWWYNEPPSGGYTRLRPGEDRTESLSLALPVDPQVVFIHDVGQGLDATSLVLEIGFYDRDLPALIYGILREAAKFTGDVPLVGNYLLDNYFRGLLVNEYLGPLSSFHERHDQQISDGWLVFGYMRGTRLGEQVLQLALDGVHIPCKAPDWLTPPNDDPACDAVVPGDINGDCKVDFADFELMALHWLQDHSE